MTDELGRVEKRFTFDAWGKRVKTADTHGSSGGVVTRGYTDHEMLEDFGLIHMNGRIYDPVLGRFLSADPFVDDASDSQAYNRYSYVSNNPLNHTDPSGYFKLKDALIIVAIVAISIITYGTASAVVGGWMTTAGVGSMTAAAVTTGAALVSAGFASGFAASLLNGGSLGDAFKAGLCGAAVGAGTFLGGALGGAAVSGWIADAQGGSFGGAFASSLAGSLGGMYRGNWYARLAVSSLAGGTASTIGGGKFANGAYSAAFAYTVRNLPSSNDLGFSKKASNSIQLRNGPDPIEAKVNKEMLQELDQKRASGVIRPLNSAEQKLTDAVITGMWSYKNPQLRSVGTMLAGRTILVDESMRLDPELRGETTPTLPGYENIMRINPLIFEDPGFSIPDGYGRETIPWGVWETLTHENLHLLYREIGLRDPGGPFNFAHTIMETYQNNMMKNMIREGSRAQVFGRDN